MIRLTYTAEGARHVRTFASRRAAERSAFALYLQGVRTSIVAA